MGEPSIRPTLAVVASVAIVVTGVIKTLWTQVLFADGSSYVIQIVAGRSFFDVPHRTFSTWIMEGPMVVGVRLFDVRSYQLLAVLLGFGYFVVPALVCGLAIFIARKWQGPLVFASVATAILLCLSGGMLMECTLATSIFILAATVFLLPERLRAGHLAMALAASVLALNTYESFAVLAPILIVLTVLRQLRSKDRPPKWFAVTNCTILVAATGVNLYALFGPQVNGARDSLVTGAIHLNNYSAAARHDIYWTIGLIGALLGLGAIGLLTQIKGAALVCLASLACVFALSPLVLHSSILPGDSFHLRGDAVALVVVTAAGLVLWQILRPGLRTSASTLWGFVVVLSLAVFSITNTLVVATGWSQYQHQFAQQVNTRQGSVSVMDLDIDPFLAKSYGWGWTNSTLGVTLASLQGRMGVVNAPGSPPPPSQLVANVNAYAVTPSIATLPPGLLGYRW